MPRIARPPARAACVAASGVLVAGTAVLAFDSGGYFEEARAVAGVVAWVVLALLALALPSERLVPNRTAIVAFAGLALLTVWTAIAKSWAPLPDFAADDLERLVLYMGAFAAALLAFSEPVVRRWLEPGLALVALVVVGYGLAGRFLPGIFDLTASGSAHGRLDQPLTYWNAMGAVAAIGLVLLVRLAGDPDRPRPLRVAAGALSPLLGLGTYLSFSRGSLLAVLFGLAVLLCIAPRRGQIAVAAVAVAAGGIAALLATAFPAFESLSGGNPERDGLAMLALTAFVCAAVGGATRLVARSEAEAAMPGVPSRRARIAVAVLTALALLIPVFGAPLEFEAGDAPDRGAGAERLRSAGSARYAYWEVALEAVPDRPLKGVGPGGFRVLWMEERPIDEAARDAHSLQLETVAELGLPGLALLAVLGAATWLAAAAGLRRDPPGTAGPVAALVAWALTTSVDWIWEMPAVALLGLLLSAALLRQAEATPASRAAG